MSYRTVSCVATSAVLRNVNAENNGLRWRVYNFAVLALFTYAIMLLILQLRVLDNIEISNNV